MRAVVRALCALLLLASAGTTAAADASPTAEGFRRGVNLNQWLDAYATGPVSAQELRNLRAAGFDHARLPVDPVALGWSPKRGPALPDMDRLRDAIDAILGSGLDVIVDMHLEADTQKAIEDDSDQADAFVALWSWLAAQLRQTPSDRVAVELLNEPQYYGLGGSIRWSRYQQRLVRTVRAVLPRHPIVVSGRDTGSLEGLVELSPLDDDRLIYSFHFYLPAIFTHQGAVWMRDVPWTTAGHWRDVRYPAKRARQTLPHMDGKGDRKRGRDEIYEYFVADWDRAEIATQWRSLEAWAREHPRARIRLGEFGVIRAGVDPVSRYRWIEEVRSLAEANGWGWTVWNYGSDFGIASRSNTRGEPRGELEAPALRALGLDARPQ